MKIGIVNDMFMAVEAMRRVLSGAAGHRVCWIARDGVEAVAKCGAETPDLILMDLLMPKMDGVEATRQIMAKTPCAILVVTASVEDHASRVFEAMGAGALDAVNTPVLVGFGTSSTTPGITDGAGALLAKIETIRKLVGGRESGDVRLAGSTANADDRTERRESGAGLSRTDFPLVLMGASAGGPAAMAKILSSLPADFPAAIVAVQHVDAQFAPGLATWLGSQSPLRVRLAEQSERLEPGTVFLAAREEHLVLASASHLGYTKLPLDCSYRPSVDVLFRSVAEHWHGTAAGVLLTGMGRDGAAGLRALRERGHLTLAQDATTSAVFGMPKAAAELGAAAEVLPLGKIGARLRDWVTASRKLGLKK